MSARLSSSPVLRSQVFTINDGTVVVQWSETRVQDIHTGRYREFSHRDFGRRLTDYDLDRLKELAVIEHYNHAYIWLYAMPEQGRFDALRTQEKSSTQSRYFYLNTTLPADQLEQVRGVLEESGLHQLGAEAHNRDGVVAITGERAMLFLTLEEAEQALGHVLANASEFLGATTIAFANVPTFVLINQEEDDEVIDLDALIADQDSRRDE
jgi:hypothetical protein